MAIEVRRAADRFTTRTESRITRHSFSFGGHYDPDNVGLGSLVAHNDDLLLPGGGYDTHPHQDVEIVTWVLEGSLHHEDSQGNAGTIRPGLAQRMSAGSGVRHAERNPADRPVRFVQMWLRPRETGRPPSYEQRDVSAALASGELVPVASGLPDVAAAIGLGAPAALHVARLSPGDAVQLPGAPYLHLFVARGRVVLDGTGPLEEGDAVRCRDEDRRRLVADGATEVLVWQLAR
jgi:quercetin 2,3-dioxygenase